MGWMAEKLEFDSQHGRDFLFSAASRLALVPTQPILWVLGALSLVVKWVGHENYCLSLYSAEVNNCTGTPSLAHTSSWHGA
jgi:hypothetical protein